MVRDLKVSIVTVCFNSEKTIQRAIESVLKQTYPNIEYIIIDGKSTDNTVQLIEGYRSQFGERLKVISEPDRGIYDAMNKGIALATGDLIGILNSDDYYEPDAVEVMAAAWTDEKYLVLYGFQRCVTHGEEDSIVFYHHRNLPKQMISHPTCFVTSGVYQDFGGFDAAMKSSADYEFLLRLFYSGQVTFKPVYRLISNFESGGMSGSETGVRETAKLRYSRGIISRKRYWVIIVRSYLSSWLRRSGR